MSRRPKASDETLIELFLDMLSAERGAGENTLVAYRNDLEDLSACLRASRKTITEATTDDLRKFLVSLSERGFKSSSLARRLSAGVTADLQRRGLQPFLHAWATNTAAIALYESLGFELRAMVNIAVLKRLPP